VEKIKSNTRPINQSGAFIKRAELRSGMLDAHVKELEIELAQTVEDHKSLILPTYFQTLVRAK
jgi:hypothetical protein